MNQMLLLFSQDTLFFQPDPSLCICQDLNFEWSRFFGPSVVIIPHIAVAVQKRHRKIVFVLFGLVIAENPMKLLSSDIVEYSEIQASAFDIFGRMTSYFNSFRLLRWLRSRLFCLWLYFIPDILGFILQEELRRAFVFTVVRIERFH